MADSRSGSRSPTFANSIISLATAAVARSLRSTNPSLPNVASNAADIFAMSSGPNESSRSRNGRIGMARLLVAQAAPVKMELGRFASQGLYLADGLSPKREPRPDSQGRGLGNPHAGTG